MELAEIVKHSPKNKITAYIGDISFANYNYVNGFNRKTGTIKDYFGDGSSLKKINDSLKMVMFNGSIDESFDSLSVCDKKKVDLAFKLLSKSNVVMLEYFEKGFNFKEIRFFKNLFKKLKSYNISIIVHTNNVNFLMGLVDRICVVNNNSVVKIYDNIDWFDKNIYDNIDYSSIIKFIYNSITDGVSVSKNIELSELIKDIYRLVGK